jgi:hypothetical protein
MVRIKLWGQNQLRSWFCVTTVVHVEEDQLYERTLQYLQNENQLRS